MEPIQLEQGHVYLIRTRMGQQKYEREHLLTFLGDDSYLGLQFNARPYAGTQTLHWEDILEIRYVGAGVGRDNDEHYLNKVIK